MPPSSLHGHPTLPYLKAANDLLLPGMSSSLGLLTQLPRFLPVPVIDMSALASAAGGGG